MKKVNQYYVTSILKYAAETWTLTGESVKRLNAFEMQTLGKNVLDTVDTAKVTNKEVFYNGTEACCSRMRERHEEEED